MPSETLHHPLSFSKREMAVFCTVIDPLVVPMIKARHDLAFRCTVGAQLVRNDPFRNEALAFYQFDQKPLCSTLVSPGLKDFLKNDAVLIDRAPQPV